MLRRKKGNYFKRIEGSPEPIKIQIKKCVNFSEVDAMGIVWHGNYLKYFEEASAVLGRMCGLSYQDYYRAEIQAPIVQLHVDYHLPLFLEENFTVEAAYVWSEGARLHTEFAIYRDEGIVTVTGYTIQMFIEAVSKTAILTTPELVEGFRKQWQEGSF